MFVGVMAFFARISDTSVGGTYMTMLNTFTNLGGNWPSWVALRFVSDLTWKSCSGVMNVLSCRTEQDEQVSKLLPSVNLQLASYLYQKKKKSSRWDVLEWLTG